MRNKTVHRFPIFLALLLLCGAAQAQVARTIRYDGRLERGGHAVDGDVTLEFSIHGSARPGEGAQLWPAQGHHAMPVHVTAGQFFVELGGDGTALPAAVFAAPSLFVETVVDGVTLTPRRSIGAVPFAVRADNGVPPGTIISWGGDVANGVPGGWLLCDGRGVGSADYPELFRSIGRGWGNGTSRCPAGAACDFNLPDLRGTFLRGVDAGAGRDPAGGRDRGASQAGGNVGDNVGSVQDWSTARPRIPLQTDNPAHSHSIGMELDGARVGAHLDYVSGPGNTSHLGSAGFGQGSTGETTHSHTVTGGGDAETRPFNAAVNFLVKY